MIKQTNKLVILSLFLAIAIILNIVENVTINFIIVPGIKLGLANIPAIFILYYYGYKEMFLVNILRVIIASLISGTLFSMPFTISFLSAIGSMLILLIFYATKKFSIYGISIIQAVFFNVFQILVVCFLYQSNIFLLYLPYLVLSGIVMGYIVALCAKFIVKTMKFV